MPYIVAVGGIAFAVKLYPHFRQIVTPRLASVPHDGQILRFGLVINHMIERIMNPKNQIQKIAANPIPVPMSLPASHPDRPGLPTAYWSQFPPRDAIAEISNAPMSAVNNKTAHDIFRHRNGFTKPTSNTHSLSGSIPSRIRENHLNRLGELPYAC